jgi:diguanylate cyclase (GGDEF)-like protein/PAS domain S-box-containing protein
MVNSYSKKISTRLAVLLLALAAVVIIISSFTVYKRNYEQQQTDNQLRLSQLIDTISKTASIAAFVNDAELAKEVVSGLIGNDLISAAKIYTPQQTLFAVGDFSSTTHEEVIHYPLLSPFDDQTKVGELLIKDNKALIEEKAKILALENAFLIMLNSLLLILAVIFLLNHSFITIVKNIASTLHSISLGSAKRVSINNSNKHNELGMLVSDINSLLEHMETQIQHERSLRAEVEQLEKRFRNIFEQTRGGLALIDKEGILQMHNPAFEKLIGSATMARLVASPKESIFSVFQLTNADLTHVFHKTISDDEPLKVDLFLDQYGLDKWINCSISLINKNDEQQLYEVMIHDISARRMREENLKIQAVLDPLTGIYNRRGGKQKVEERFDSAKGKDTQYAIMMIDLDNFKPVNDKYGHDVGDAVLKNISKRIKTVIRNDDITIRWGGDEFLVVIKQESNDNNVQLITEKLLTVIASPINLENEITITVGASIGVAIYPSHGANLDELVQNADNAMYEVKSNNKHDFAVFDYDRSGSTNND